MIAERKPVEKIRASQALLLRRVMFASVSYLITLSLTAIFWWLGYITLPVLLTYFGIILALNAGFYLAIRTGFNLRFADPGMTAAQILLASAAGLYVMYFAQQARGVFLLLSFAPRKALCIFPSCSFGIRNKVSAQCIQERTSRCHATDSRKRLQRF